MPKEMLINVSAGEECRIALLEDGRLEELYMERTSSTSHVGNIYKGRVTNVEASIQAAFVDFGLGRNGFLHISDLMPSYFGRRGEDIQESVGKKMARRDRPPIQRCLRRGDEIVVQIIKEGIGTKGPTLSTYLSIPGKMLVMMPGMGKMGVSKKIEDDQERRRLRQILDSLKPPKDVAFIIRTAGVGKTKIEIERDLKYLTRLWEILKKKEQEPGPVELYTEGDLVTRTVRDLFSADVERIVVDNEDVAKRVKEVIKISSPRAKNRVDIYENPVPLFHQANIEAEIEQMYSRYVPLPSGGSLVIDSTEAVVAIDVNSGKNRENNDAEMTAFKVDMEAADEIPRQLKLRDLGGVIICDFIDLRYERHRRELEARLYENFKNDRAKTKVLRMSQFGIIELTRQRMRPSLKRSIYFDCPHCKGAGLIKTPESISLDVMRKLAIALNDMKVVRAELSVCPDVAFYLLNKKRAQLSDLEAVTKKRILIRSDNSLGLDELKFELFDIRDGIVILEEIGMTFPDRAHTSQLGRSPAGHTHQGRSSGGRSNNQRGGRGRGKDQRPLPTRAAEDDRDEMDEDRAAIERGEDTADEIDLQGGYIEPMEGREEDPTDIPQILETEAGDEVAEELADEEMGEGQSADREPQDQDEDRDQVQDRDRNPGNNRGGRQQGRDFRQGGERGNQDGRDRYQGGNRDNQPRQNQDAGRSDSYRGDQNRGRNNQGNQGRPEQNRGDQNRQNRNEPGRAFQGQGGQNQPRQGGPNQSEQGGQNQPRQGGQNQPAMPDQDFNRGPEGQSTGEPGQGGGRRRRRRRGRRGRGGSNANEPMNGEPNGNIGAPEFNQKFNQSSSEFYNESAPPSDESTGEMADEFHDETLESDQSPEVMHGNTGIGADADVVADDSELPLETKGAAPAGEGETGAPRRRRRRGGRRHRRRGAGEGAEVSTGQPADSDRSDEAIEAEEEVEAVIEVPAVEEPVIEEIPVEEEAPARKAKAKPKRVRKAAASRATAPKRIPPKKRKAAAEPEVEVNIASAVVPTGSADKHLVGNDEPMADDEPVTPQPLSRPRSYRDLDAIPDDYD
jgi:ribonuclease E